MSASVSSSNRFPEIEKYDLLEEVGHGGMATVYRAVDQRLDREVAVKVIHKHLRENAEVRRRFVAEAKAVAKLRHRGIVEVYDVSDEAQEERFLVVELIRGYSLRQLLVDREVLPPEIGATIVLILAEAVQHAHEAGVIHRDIKPENVLIEPPRPLDSGDGDGAASAPRLSDGHSGISALSHEGVIVKLTDFGIAKVLDAQGVTSTGQILGSPAHMAPEQIEGGAVGSHTDVFALGVLLYECIVGHLPFEGKNPAQVLRRVLDGDFDPAEVERPEVGGRWGRIIAEALSTDVETRTATAADLGARIAAELDALGIEDPRSDLTAYFRDEEAYVERATETMVPRLVARGEHERRLGRVPDAAADFNRALALRPNDAAILKRITKLSSQTMWAERGRRIGAILLGSGLLFGATYGASRFFKAVPPIPTPDGTPTAATTGGTPAPTAADAGQPPDVPSATTTGAPPPTTATTSTPTGRPKVPPSPKATGAPPPPTSEATTGRVKFVVFPKGATLVVDGVKRSWPYEFELPAGPHSYQATVEGSQCCKEATGSFSVEASDDPAAVLPVNVVVPIRPATFVLSGGPGDASVFCKGGTSTPGRPVSVTMTKLQEPVSCEFSSGNKVVTTLKAGEVTTIMWP